MKNIEKLLFVLILLSFQSLSIGQSINAEASQISFDIKNMFSTVNGNLDGLSGTITFDESNLETAIFDVCLPANSLSTDNKRRDSHLMSEDYFNALVYEDICFEASRVEKLSKGYVVSGDLTIHGVSQEVEIPFTYENNKFEGQLKIDRYDFGIGGTGDFMIGRDVDIQIVAFIK